MTFTDEDFERFKETLQEDPATRRALSLALGNYMKVLETEMAGYRLLGPKALSPSQKARVAEISKLHGSVKALRKKLR